MPRRGRRFDRSKAVTFEVVYRPLRDSGDVEHGLRRVDPRAPSSLEGSSANVVEDDLGYARKEYELGEFGLPSDGYDYSKHFRTIGGTGGVYVAAPGTEIEAPKGTSSFQLRDAVKAAQEKEKSETVETQGVIRRVEDEELRATSIAEIQRLRRRIPDLDAIFQELDSDGELEDEDEEEVAETTSAKRVQFKDASTSDGDDILQDDFILVANREDDSSTNAELGNMKDSISRKTPPRQASTLDEQFEELLKSYEDGDDSLDDDDVSLSPREEETVDVALEELDASELALLNDFENLNLEHTGTVVDQRSINGLEDDENVFVSADGTVFESDVHAEQQLSKAMDTLLNANKRVTADEAFDAIDGIDVARRAIREREKLEKEHLSKLDGMESDSNDSELDTLMGDMYQDRQHWDCETIVSTYTNLDNHPSVVDEDVGVRRRNRELPPVIRLDPRTQLPVGAHGIADKETSCQDAHDDDFGARRRPLDATSSARPKGESKQEKRNRKAAVKIAARERRKVKKEMKRAFGTESRVQSAAAVAQGETKTAVRF